MNRFALLVVSSLSLLGCWNEIEGGPEVSQTRTLGSFSKVRAESGLTVKVQPGEPSATIVAPQKVEEHLQTLIIEGTLVVRIRPGVRVTNLESTEVTVSAQDLEQVETTAGTQVSVSGLSAISFKAIALGGSRLVLAGTVKDLRLDVAGGSTLISKDVDAEVVSLTVTGGSTVETSSTRSVVGRVLDGSTVLVGGTGDFSTISAAEGSTVTAAPGN